MKTDVQQSNREKQSLKPTFPRQQQHHQQQQRFQIFPQTLLQIRSTTKQSTERQEKESLLKETTKTMKERE